MKDIYSNLDIHFTLENLHFHVLNMTHVPFLRKVPNHSHGIGSYEIHYISEGYGIARVDGTPYTLTPNTVFVTGPNIEHSQIPSSQNPMREYCIYLKIEQEKKTQEHDTPNSITTLFQQYPFWFGQDAQTIPTIMQSLFHELEHQYIGYKENVQALLSQLIVSLVRNYSKANKSLSHFSSSTPAQTKPLLIEDCFLFNYKTLTLKSLADVLGLSPRQTERYLKEYYGKTFIQKRTESRMSAAVLLLADSSRSITSISEELGYSSIEHFSSAFKKYYHCSAKEYRQKMI